MRRQRKKRAGAKERRYSSYASTTPEDHERTNPSTLATGSGGVWTAGYPGAEDGHEPFALTRYGANVDVTVSPLIYDGKRPLESVTHALIDTGAEESCIDERLATKLRMPVVDTVAIFWAQETRDHNVYAANIVVHHLKLGVQGRFVGIDFTPGDIPQEVILGRTFLEGVVMNYDGLKGQVTLVSP